VTEVIAIEPEPTLRDAAQTAAASAPVPIRVLGPASTPPEVVVVVVRAPPAARRHRRTVIVGLLQFRGGVRDVLLDRALLDVQRGGDLRAIQARVATDKQLSPTPRAPWSSTPSVHGRRPAERRRSRRGAVAVSAGDERDHDRSVFSGSRSLSSTIAK
jgi:hypothetical protein